MSIKTMREAGEDLTEGKSLQPNSNWLQIHWAGLQTTAGETTNLEASKCRVFPNA